MVAGLLDLVNGCAPYSFEVPSSRCIIFNPVELLFNGLRRFQADEGAGAYGVDLLRARVLFERVIEDALKYDLKLIPVFGGMPDRPGLVLKSVASRCLKMKKYCNVADLDIAPSRYRPSSQFLPCSRQLVTNCLQGLGLHCVQSSYNSFPVCLGIAYCLDCPIASMSTKYFLVSQPKTLPDEARSLVVNEMKLVDLNADFYRVDNEDGKDVFKLRVFHPELSVLGSVPATSRPLIALLMNSNLIPTLPAPIRVEPSESESFTSAKLRGVIDWVAKTNPIHVLQAVIESATNSNYADYLSDNILKYLGDFCPNFVEASQVLRLLNLESGIPLMSTPTKGANLCKKQQQQRPSSPLFFFEAAASILKGVAHLSRPPDFSFHWPVALLYLYRYNMLEKSLILAVYSEFGAIFKYTNEYLIKLPCVYGPSRILRYAHYCLMKGVEDENGLAFKLVGLRPYAREICYEGDFRFKAYMIEVKSMHLPSHCSADDFIYAFVGLDCTLDVPDWSVALVLSCLLWHQQKEEHRGCEVAECPLILSVLVVAVATHFNMRCGMLAVVDHYDSLKSSILTKMEANGISPSPTVEKELIHSVLELMLVYDHYISLSRLLTALQDGSRTPDFSSAAYNRFPPQCVVFPSLALLVHLAAHLRCEDAASGVAMRLWLVNAFLRTANDADDVEKLKDAVTVFSTLQRFVSTVKLNFTAPKVEVTDPPPCFLPKAERSSPKRRAHPSGPAFLSKPRDSSIAESKQSNNRMRPLQPSRTGNASKKKGGSYANRLLERVERIKLDS